MSRGRGYSSSLSGGLALGGRPTLLLFLIISRVSSGYMASRVMGFIPALCMRRSIVLGGKPSSFAISVKVNPFIFSIIGVYQKFIKKSRIFQTFFLTNCLKYPTI